MASIPRSPYSKVYLARKTTTQDLFAIKVIRKSEMVRKNMMNSVFAERTVLALVRNPFVVKMFYAFHSRDHLFLVRPPIQRGGVGPPGGAPPQRLTCMQGR